MSPDPSIPFAAVASASEPSDVNAPTTESPLGWGLYLGMSWTWVIGMFLPVLLIRDYGVWAWVIFAIPNCLGAAAMGWVMRSSAQSRELVRQHAMACRLFSLVTISFHLFFASWMLPQLVGGIGWVVAAVLVQLAFTPLFRRRGALLAAMLICVISLAIALLLQSRGVLMFPQPRPFSAMDIAGLAMVCLLGFIACPYLDLTFHRARQRTTNTGAKIAFGTGFCIFFASMIVVTLLYAINFNFLVVRPGTVSAWLVFLHMAIQMSLTVTLHSGTAYDEAETRDDVSNYRAMLGAALGLGLAGGMVHFFSASNGYSYAGLSIGEIIYRIYLSFYGLLFPAYALFSLLAGRVNWKATLIASALAIPFYWLAFIERRMEWALIGGAIVLVVGAWQFFAKQRNFKTA